MRIVFTFFQCSHNIIRKRLRCVRRELASPSGLWVQSCRSHSRCLDARPLSFYPGQLCIHSLLGDALAVGFSAAAAARCSAPWCAMH